MLQAAKRAGAAAESRPDRHAATGSARSVGPTGHAGLEPRPMVTPSLPQPVLERREDRVTALTIVVAFVRARRPCLAAPGSRERRTARSPAVEAQCSRQPRTTQVPAVAGGIDGLLMGARVGRHLGYRICRHICLHIMMWRPCSRRSCRSARLSMGPSGPRLVSIVPPAGHPPPLGDNRRPLSSGGVAEILQIPPEGCLARRWNGRRPSTAPRIQVVRMEGSQAQPDGGLLMSYPPTDPTSASRLSSPPHRTASNSSLAAAVPASLERAELPELSDPPTAATPRWRRHSGPSAPTETGATRFPRRSTAASRAELGVRRPLIAQMPADRREQAISAIADLLIVQLKREA
jgi:hypothetical protein